MELEKSIALLVKELDKMDERLEKDLNRTIEFNFKQGLQNLTTV